MEQESKKRAIVPITEEFLISLLSTKGIFSIKPHYLDLTAISAHPNHTTQTIDLTVEGEGCPIVKEGAMLTRFYDPIVVENVGMELISKVEQIIHEMTYRSLSYEEIIERLAQLREWLYMRT